MDLTVRERIQSQIESHAVVLFMKGTRQMPQCGFSATLIQILDSLLDDYTTVNVLADSDIRQGIKDFSDWPTIPQLYVKGEFLGGCDIVKDMYANGQLETALGQQVKPVEPPSLTITPAALESLLGAIQSADECVRLEIDDSYRHGLSIGPKGPRDVAIEAGGVTLVLDGMSAGRAEGVTIDFIDTPDGKSFKITNPNEPPRVKAIGVKELKERLDRGEVQHFFDVRTAQEREIATIEGARILDRETQDHIVQLPKESPLYFHCHHGGRSQQAAEFFLGQGFREVYNVVGGIDAWSQEVDSDVPRYE